MEVERADMAVEQARETRAFTKAPVETTVEPTLGAVHEEGTESVRRAVC